MGSVSDAFFMSLEGEALVWTVLGSYLSAGVVGAWFLLTSRISVY